MNPGETSGVGWPGAWLCGHMQRGCGWPHICIFTCQQPLRVLSIAADEHVIRWLQRSRRSCRGSGGEGGAGGRGCPLPPLGRKRLSALRRYKSFIRFVVFLTKGSRSRNKPSRSIPSAPISSQPQNTHYLTLSGGQRYTPAPTGWFEWWVFSGHKCLSGCRFFSTLGLCCCPVRLALVAIENIFRVTKCSLWSPVSWTPLSYHAQLDRSSGLAEKAASMSSFLPHLPSLRPTDDD